MRQRACTLYVASPSPGQSATITAASSRSEICQSAGASSQVQSPAASADALSGSADSWISARASGMDDVDWPKPDLSAVEISPVDDVRIALPDGRSFESDGDTVHDITLDRRGDTVRNVQIDSHPRSAADAHELAVQWAEEWDLSREPLDRWRDGATKTPAITSGRPVERIGDDGPVPIVEIRNSFQDESPALVSLQFYWPE